MKLHQAVPGGDWNPCFPSGIQYYGTGENLSQSISSSSIMMIVLHISVCISILRSSILRLNKPLYQHPPPYRTVGSVLGISSSSFPSAGCWGPKMDPFGCLQYRSCVEIAVENSKSKGYPCHFAKNRRVLSAGTKFYWRHTS